MTFIHLHLFSLSSSFSLLPPLRSFRLQSFFSATSRSRPFSSLSSSLETQTPNPSSPVNATSSRSGALSQPPIADVRQKIDANPPKGTRDFPPEEMRLRSWLFQNFRDVSQLFGFEEVDFPVLESEALFIRKAGEEIRDQVSRLSYDACCNCFIKLFKMKWLRGKQMSRTGEESVENCYVGRIVGGCVPITTSQPYSQQCAPITTITTSSVVLDEGQCVHELPTRVVKRLFDKGGRTAHKASPPSSVKVQSPARVATGLGVECKGRSRAAACDRWVLCPKTCGDLLQLYCFEDRGNRRVVLRPELTPSLARLVIQKGKSISLPLKWFAIGQCWRYERMTRGRRREHYQWNMDIIGVPDVTVRFSLDENTTYPELLYSLAFE
ncbi:hypothetical protein Cgig2_011769 [Carnegiea gigantea]|uniref:histidine--tRNA ligase n=1 Tax=Carnegiea gigantea TaxID=171969 RepID=A0A9Q1JUP0_9CARY|nr:hypothetical protein Cgig2_011769 [Carnegiea gigantea]